MLVENYDKLLRTIDGKQYIAVEEVRQGRAGPFATPLCWLVQNMHGQGRLQAPLPRPLHPSDAAVTACRSICTASGHVCAGGRHGP